MKKILIVMACFALCIASCTNEVNLPDEAQKFVSRYFPGVAVTLIDKDFNSYEVALSNGSLIEFNKKGEWKEIDCKNSPVPASIIASLPAPIFHYVIENYPGTFIVEVSKGKNYGIELISGVELEFSLDGEFQKVD